VRLTGAVVQVISDVLLKRRCLPRMRGDLGIDLVAADLTMAATAVARALLEAARDRMARCRPVAFIPGSMTLGNAVR
jgi:hypothetical protein